MIRSILVKYDPNGLAQWAAGISSESSRFYSLAVDAFGNVFTVGNMTNSVFLKYKQN